MNMRRVFLSEPGTTDQLPVRPWLLPGRAVLARTVPGLDAGEDEIDAGEELLAVVVFAQLRPGSVHGRVPGGVELRPLRGDGGEESRPVHLAAGERAGVGGVLPSDAEDVV